MMRRLRPDRLETREGCCLRGGEVRSRDLVEPKEETRASCDDIKLAIGGDGSNDMGFLSRQKADEGGHEKLPAVRRDTRKERDSEGEPTKPLKTETCRMKYAAIPVLCLQSARPSPGLAIQKWCRSGASYSGGGLDADQDTPRTAEEVALTL